ncbi:MAG: hypothetical protein AABY15_02120 [Nanoarchaeota archaeon]
MNLKEYKEQELEIEKDYELRLHKLRKKYVEDKAEFKKGNFIFNVTGIIKIERVGYKMFFDTPEIVYYGYRYRKIGSSLLRTKNKKISSLQHSLKLVKI